MKEIRFATNESGHAKGYAFVEFEDEVNISSYMKYLYLKLPTCRRHFPGFRAQGAASKQP